MTAAAPAASAWRARAAAMAVPASLTWAMIGTRPATCLIANSRSALLGVGEAHGFARMHRQRERIGAVAQMKVEEPGKAREIDARVRRERRHRNMHEGGREGGHKITSRAARLRECRGARARRRWTPAAP